jgi:hypothetical protein
MKNPALCLVAVKGISIAHDCKHAACPVSDMDQVTMKRISSSPCLRANKHSLCAPSGRKQMPDFIEKFGAGEGIRTLDPNLGKVVLYH